MPPSSPARDPPDDFRHDIRPYLLPLAMVYAFLGATAAIIPDGFLA